MSERRDHLEAVQAARWERMVALVRELDRATAMGEPAPLAILAHLDRLLCEAAEELRGEVAALLAGCEAAPVGGPEPVN